MSHSNCICFTFDAVKNAVLSKYLCLSLVLREPYSCVSVINKHWQSAPPWIQHTTNISEPFSVTLLGTVHTAQARAPTTFRLPRDQSTPIPLECAQSRPSATTAKRNMSEESTGDSIDQLTPRGGAFYGCHHGGRTRAVSRNMSAKREPRREFSRDQYKKWNQAHFVFLRKKTILEKNCWITQFSVTSPSAPSFIRWKCQAKTMMC